MANPHRGQVSLVAGDTTYTLALTTNAQCVLEDAFGKSFDQIVGLLSSGEIGAKGVRLLLWGALNINHPDIDEMAAGDIIDEAGQQAIGEALGRALKAAFPDQENSGSRPRKAKAG